MAFEKNFSSRCNGSGTLDLEPERSIDEGEQSLQNPMTEPVEIPAHAAPRECSQSKTQTAEKPSCSAAATDGCCPSSRRLASAAVVPFPARSASASSPASPQASSATPSAVPRCWPGGRAERVSWPVHRHQSSAAWPVDSGCRAARVARRRASEHA